MQEAHDRDILLWPNGHWEFRDNVDPIWLAEKDKTEDYEVISFESDRWHTIQEV